MPKEMTTKDIIEKIRHAEMKQRVEEQKTARERIAELEKALSKPCKICEDAVNGMMTNTKTMIEDIWTLNSIYINNIYTIRFKGFDRTRDDLMAMIKTDECNIEKQFRLYEECCKTGKLPKNGKFRC